MHLTTWMFDINFLIFFSACPDVVSEDCLYLNIFVPKTHTKKLLPVFVYIHGGNFIQGNPGSSLFQGHHFAEKADTIVVTISYRLGAFVRENFNSHKWFRVSCMMTTTKLKETLELMINVWR
jgi:hypothetical protein